MRGGGPSSPSIVSLPAAPPAEMAPYVKSLDANHLLNVGEEGFYPAGIQQVKCAAWRANFGRGPLLPYLPDPPTPTPPTPPTTTQSAANPQGNSSWAVYEGQDFNADHSPPPIDFLAMHLWTDNWEDTSDAFVQVPPSEYRRHPGCVFRA